MAVEVDEWTALVGALEADRADIRRRISTRLRTELPAYEALPEEALLEAGAAPFALLLEALYDRHVTALGGASEAFRVSGARRAREGVPVVELLQTMRIAMEEVRRAAERLAPDGPERAALLLQVADIVLAWRDRGTTELARGHRAEELDAAWREAGARTELIEAVLLGGLAPTEIRARAEAHGLDPDAAYFPVRGRPAAELGMRELEHLLGLRSTGGSSPGLVARMQGDLCGFVRALPALAPPFPVGTAAPAPLFGLQGGFRLAGRALETAVALGSPGVHDLPSLGLHPAMLADPDVGAAIDARYVDPFVQRGPSGIAVLDTVERYLAEDCRLGPTAASLHLHANTVRYRLGRFEELTGTSLRTPRGIAEVWWALERRRLRHPPQPPASLTSARRDA